MKEPRQKRKTASARTAAMNSASRTWATGRARCHRERDGEPECAGHPLRKPPRGRSRAEARRSWPAPGSCVVESIERTPRREERTPPADEAEDREDDRRLEQRPGEDREPDDPRLEEECGRHGAAGRRPGHGAPLLKDEVQVRSTRTPVMHGDLRGFGPGPWRCRRRSIHPGSRPGGGSHSSTRWPSGSITQPKRPNSELSVRSSTVQPSARSAASTLSRSRTR